MDTKPIELKYPIPVKLENGTETEVNVLQLQRLKAKHLKLLPKGFGIGEGKIEPSEIIPLIAGLANISMESAGEIDVVEDLTAIAEELESFLLQSQEDGKK